MAEIKIHPVYFTYTCNLQVLGEKNGSITTEKKWRHRCFRHLVRIYTVAQEFGSVYGHTETHTPEQPIITSSSCEPTAQVN